jgi:hypothetical protein
MQSRIAEYLLHKQQTDGLPKDKGQTDDLPLGAL